MDTILHSQALWEAIDDDPVNRSGQRLGKAVERG
ncbi:MAG: hypothetical protein BWY82_02523 [Verrucomicrobia bacterium ADurb.Bin474]|nr:MAG: hypothetical protein BWY82_02523 [Verrucomicrobia bacterium ADurb.Bin474]